MVVLCLVQSRSVSAHVRGTRSRLVTRFHIAWKNLKDALVCGDRPPVRDVYCKIQNLKQHLPWELCELLRWPLVVCVGLLRILVSPRSVGLTLQVFRLVSVGKRSLGVIVVHIASLGPVGSSMTLHFGSNFVHISYVFQLFLEVISKQPVSEWHMRTTERCIIPAYIRFHDLLSLHVKFIVNMRQQQ